MSENNRNKRKLEILTILSYTTKPSLSAKEILEQSKSITLAIETIRSRLLSYLRQGIIRRIKKNNVYVKPFRYEITQRGEARLNYFLNPKEQINLLVREPIRL